MRLERREHISPLWALAAPFAAIVFTLVIASLLVLWADKPVVQTYGAILEGGFGSVFA